MNSKLSFVYFLLIVLFVLLSCEPKGAPNSGQELYQNHCGTCHLKPDPKHITKELWRASVLPEMAARMGLRLKNYNPLRNYSTHEYAHIKKSNAYPRKSSIDTLDWYLIEEYILKIAPDSFPLNKERAKRSQVINQFTAQRLVLDSISQESITCIEFSNELNHVFIGGLSGKSWEITYDKTIEQTQFNSAPVSIQRIENVQYITEIGILNPSEQKRGSVKKQIGDSIEVLIDDLHRPVFTLINDINDDGNEDVLVCEFGHFTGELSVFDGAKEYQKRTLLPFPGAIKSIITDFNNDGKKDILVLVTQETESVFVLYQKEEFKFEIQRLIQNGPEYGSSWFDLIDFNKDGYLDIVLTTGDNADYSSFPKPYHGLNIYLNDGDNQFLKNYFYPIYGATRVLSNDYDLDGDIDFAILAFFPEEKYAKTENFIYLETIDADNFVFESSVIENQFYNRWMVMDHGDFDNDGDFDIILGAFSLSFKDEYLGDNRNKTQVLLLENKRS